MRPTGFRVSLIYPTLVGGKFAPSPSPAARRMIMAMKLSGSCNYLFAPRFTFFRGNILASEDGDNFPALMTLSKLKNLSHTSTNKVATLQQFADLFLEECYLPHSIIIRMFEWKLSSKFDFFELSKSRPILVSFLIV